MSPLAENRRSPRLMNFRTIVYWCHKYHDVTCRRCMIPKMGIGQHITVCWARNLLDNIAPRIVDICYDRAAGDHLTHADQRPNDAAVLGCHTKLRSDHIRNDLQVSLRLYLSGQHLEMLEDIQNSSHSTGDRRLAPVVG
jgi:hypothetical protein